MVRKVTSAEITTHFGTTMGQLSATAAPSGQVHQQPIYEFDFQSVTKEHAESQSGKWAMEVRQQHGWELLSAGLNVGGMMGTTYLLTWRRRRA